MNNMACILCCTEIEDELNLGQFMHSDGVTVHYHCLLFASYMVQKGNDDEGILGFMPEDIRKEAERGRQYKCSYCGRMGATIFCCTKRCRYVFHLPCGVQKDSLHQYYENFRSYCHMHKRKQKVPKRYYKDKLECLICLSEVCGMPGKDQLWPPCCRNIWFHKTCIQRLALSTGYFFKCPFCNNDDLFVKEMKNQGIFVPSRDASWELEENAYSDLLSRYSHCDAKKCLCPKGRAYSAAVDRIWHIILCKTCGSQGHHRGCMKKFFKSHWEWECPDCAEISKLAQFDNRKVEAEDVLQNGISSRVQDLTEATCSTSLGEYVSDDSGSSSQVNFLVSTNAEDGPCSEVDSEEFYSYSDDSDEENAEIFNSCYASLPREINSHDEDHVLRNEETNISKTFSLSDEFMSENSTKMLLTDKNVVVSSATENASNPLVNIQEYSGVIVSQPSPLVVVSLEEFLEQKNVTQKIVSIDDTCERDNVVKMIFSGQSHKGKNLSSVAATDIPQTENQDMFSLQSQFQENVGVQMLESHQEKKTWDSCNEHTNTWHPQLINVGVQRLESNEEGSSYNKQVDTSILQSTSYTGHAENAPTTVNNSHCAYSVGNNKNVFSSNVFCDKNTVKRHNCVTDSFSRFRQQSPPSFMETNAIQSGPSEVSLQAPSSDKDACLSKTSPQLIEREGLLQNTDFISYVQEEEIVHDIFSRNTVNSVKDITKSTFQKNNTNSGKEVIELNDDIEVIDVNSDPEIIEVDDTVEPRVVFNVDENLIEID